MDIQRQWEMLRQYTQDHLTLESIAQKHGVSRERVRQLITIYPDYLIERQRRLFLTEFAVDFVCKCCGKTKKVSKSLGTKKYCDKVCKRTYKTFLLKNRTEKFCRRCQAIKPIDEFYKNYNKDRNLWSKEAYCKTCHAGMGNDWKKRHPDMVKKTGFKAVRAYQTRIKLDPVKYAIYLQKNKDRYYKLKADPEKYKLYAKARDERHKYRMKTDPEYKARRNETSRLNAAKRRLLK